MTATGRSGTGPGSRTSPACWTCRPGRPGCGSSSGRSGRIPGRSCGSPTSTGTGSPPSPPTRRRASSPNWNCGTAAGPAVRTGSGTPRTPGCGTFRPLSLAQNQLWCEIAALACELLAWTQMLALTETARRWEPKRLRLRLFSVAGRLARGGRRLRLTLAARWPWASEITAAITRLQALPSG
jgi:Transposase DDE domain group 1